MNREKLLTSNKIYQAFRIFDQVDKPYIWYFVSENRTEMETSLKSRSRA